VLHLAGGVWCACACVVVVVVVVSQLIMNENDVD
jgi:hypothetical protein